MAIAPDFIRLVRPWFDGSKPTFATVLLSALLKLHGTDVLSWDGQTIQLQVKDDLGVDMPRRVYDQLMGLVSALSSTIVYHEVEVFDALVSALNRHGVQTQHGVPDVGDVAWAVVELAQSDPEPVGDVKWSPDILAYIRVVMDDAGVSISPKSLAFVPSKAPHSEFATDPELYAGAWGGQQAAADEVDAHVDHLMQAMLKDLASLGIKPYGKQEKLPGAPFGHGEMKVTKRKGINDRIFAHSTGRV